MTSCVWPTVCCVVCCVPLLLYVVAGFPAFSAHFRARPQNESHSECALDCSKLWTWALPRPIPTQPQPPPTSPPPELRNDLVALMPEFFVCWSVFDSDNCNFKFTRHHRFSMLFLYVNICWNSRWVVNRMTTKYRDFRVNVVDDILFYRCTIRSVVNCWIVFHPIISKTTTLWTTAISILHDLALTGEN